MSGVKAGWAAAATATVVPEKCPSVFTGVEASVL
jgi:hypothetical protein